MPLPSVTTGLQFWFDARDIAGVSDGSTISTWADSSANARDAAVSTGTATYHTGVTPLGWPALTFSSCEMQITGASGIAHTGQHTLIAVYKLDSLAHWCGLVSDTTGGSPQFSVAFNYLLNYGQLEAVTRNINLDVNGSVLVAGSAAADTNWHTTGTRYQDNTGPYFFTLDGASDGSGSTTPPVSVGAPQTIGNGYVFATTQFPGRCALIGYYNRYLSDAELTTVLSGGPATTAPFVWLVM